VIWLNKGRVKSPQQTDSKAINSSIINSKKLNNGCVKQFDFDISTAEVTSTAAAAFAL
jgi:hypothetical protein